jgi:uncharacterized protein YbjT (DUF2867 family)
MANDRLTILVTGATGLTGAEIVRRLSARGVAVRALVRNATTTNAAKAAELAAGAADLNRKEPAFPLGVDTRRTT